MAHRIITTIIAAPAAPRGQRRANLITPGSQRGRGRRAREAWVTTAMEGLVCIIDTECVDRAIHRGGPRRNLQKYRQRPPGGPETVPAYSPDGPQTARTAGRSHLN